METQFPNGFTAELHPRYGWEIYSGGQYICHCGSDGQRDVLLAALNFWRGSDDERETMGRVLNLSRHNVLGDGSPDTNTQPAR